MRRQNPFSNFGVATRARSVGNRSAAGVALWDNDFGTKYGNDVHKTHFQQVNSSTGGNMVLGVDRASMLNLKAWQKSTKFSSGWSVGRKKMGSPLQHAPRRATGNITPRGTKAALHGQMDRIPKHPRAVVKQVQNRAQAVLRRVAPQPGRGPAA
ncbi:MAG: hypothetical protein EA357_08090 [Micavibrio sp.]|jgi:hypothetical protein|nr:MAG: hypothetical protein EA357_08090 [Micavibrio sp.]